MPTRTTSETYQNELLSSLDVNAEWRTGSVKSKLRLSGAMENGFEEGDGNIGSVAAAYLETAFSDWGLVSRIGRQTRNTGGVVGRFDGGLLAGSSIRQFASTSSAVHRSSAAATCRSTTTPTSTASAPISDHTSAASTLPSTRSNSAPTT